MTPETIITSDIKCPRCDAPFSHFEGVNTRAFQCGSIAQRAYMACNYATSLRARVKELEDALHLIGEYWNRDNNESAMQDACWHAINTSAEALEKGTKP